MIKYNLSESAYNKLSEDMQKLYKKGDDGYELQVEGAVSKAKVDEFRDKNIALTNDLKKFDGVDVSKWGE
ncbi:MAG: hypothetical protein GY951_13870, partial [Psychromonas sp.]|nr:hypothetical protein [Psychromonas sp.]